MERVSFRHRGLTETPVSGDQLPLSEATAGRELERQECRVSGAFEVEGLVVVCALRNGFGQMHGVRS